MVDEPVNVSPENLRTDRRRELSRIQGNQRRRRVAYAIIGVGLLFIVGILIAGYTIIFVMPPRQLVVRVGEVEYTRGDMVELLRVRQRSTEFLGQPFNASTDVFQALNLIVENEIIAQAAPRFGLSVSDGDVEFEIRRLMANTASESAGKTEGQIELEYEERYRAYLNQIQVREADHRQLVRRTILRERFRQYIGDNVPSVVPQVQLYRLAVTANDEIDVMKIKYKDMAGTSDDPQAFRSAFFEITREFSRDDSELVRRGGDLGWVPQGIYKDFDHVIFDLEPGNLSEPVRNPDVPQQLFVFMVAEKSDARQLSDFNRDALKTEAMQNWLNEERRDKDVYAVFNSDIYNWMVEQLGLSASITPTPPPNPFQSLGAN